MFHFEDNHDYAQFFAQSLAWLIAKFHNRMPAELEVGPPEMTSGQVGSSAGNWTFIYPIRFKNTGKKPINKYGVEVRIPPYLLKSGDDGKYSFHVSNDPGKSLLPDKSVLIAQPELRLSKELLVTRKADIEKDFILCTYSMEGFTVKERRIPIKTICPSSL